MEEMNPKNQHRNREFLVAVYQDMEIAERMGFRDGFSSAKRGFMKPRK